MKTFHDVQKLVLDLYEAATKINCGQGDLADYEALEKALIAFEEVLSPEALPKFDCVAHGDTTALVKVVHKHWQGVFND